MFDDNSDYVIESEIGSVERKKGPSAVAEQNDCKDTKFPPSNKTFSAD